MIHDDTGSVTLEAAMGIASLITIMMVAFVGLATVGAHIHATHAAGSAARAAAIGEDPATASERATITVRRDPTWVHVTAEVPAPIGTATAQASFPMELAP
ncbi:Uncharacterised protein [Corynebacterium renale]|uniref:TadE family type IV pilus minor pilin n=1 Tax=Corynebacterium renale TaxID=1724 RepID=UPI000DA36C9D|nr:TadE family type IV pilus minor pilin [Corynebacterium renale]SQG63869.1 Uncharacterised protein [Corynebacterium renale]STD02532.1 Uncharacterised protein [Corynebacterium renale]